MFSEDSTSESIRDCFLDCRELQDCRWCRRITLTVPVPPFVEILPCLLFLGVWGAVADTLHRAEIKKQRPGSK